MIFVLALTVLASVLVGVVSYFKARKGFEAGAYEGAMFAPNGEDRSYNEYAGNLSIEAEDARKRLRGFELLTWITVLVVLVNNCREGVFPVANLPAMLLAIFLAVVAKFLFSKGKEALNVTPMKNSLDQVGYLLERMMSKNVKSGFFTLGNKAAHRRHLTHAVYRGVSFMLLCGAVVLATPVLWKGWIPSIDFITSSRKALRRLFFLVWHYDFAV